MPRLIEKTDDRPLTRLGDAMRPRKAPTPLEDQAIKEVWSMAKELATLPQQRRNAYLYEIRKQTSGRQRWLATQHTPPEHEMFRPLMAMLDALIASEPGAIPTKHGTFLPDDMAAHHGKLVVEEGRRMLVFPWTWPWRKKPNKETGAPGERGDPLYRRPEERGPVLLSFRAVSRDDAATTAPEPEWWQKRPGDDE